MACTPTPTSTVFSTSTSTSFTLTTVTTSEVDTITSTSTSVWTSCLAQATASGGSVTCVSSTVGTSSSLIPVVTTVPITQTNTVPVNVPVQVPIQTLFSDCPSDGNSQPQQPSSTQGDNEDSSTSQSHTRITVTSFITYSDSNGVHVTQSTSVSDGQLNQGDGGTHKNSTNLAPIIGGVVGGVLAILALIGLGWYILWRRDQNRFLFDEEDEDGVFRPKSVGRRGRRSLNLDDEPKGLDSTAYQYGMVGSTTSPSTSPLPHSQFSSLGGYSHRRSLSREALMTTAGPSSIPNSPQRLDVPLGSAQRRISQNTSSSTRGESIMMTNQPVQNRPSDDTVPWGHHPRPSSSLLETPIVYPPGATGGTGFYQQYGPLDSQPAGSPAPASPTRGMHKPPLEPTLIPATQPVQTHQTLLAAAGLAEPSTSRATVVAAPPPGAAGARPYVEYREAPTDLQSAVMASADRATASPTPSGGSGVDVGFGRQRRPEKTPRIETPRSPVIQHEDAGRVPNPSAPQDAPPPAYSDS